MIFFTYHDIIHILIVFFYFSSILYPSNSHFYFVDNVGTLCYDSSHRSLIHMIKIYIKKTCIIPFPIFSMQLRLNSHNNFAQRLHINFVLDICFSIF